MLGRRCEREAKPPLVELLWLGLHAAPILSLVLAEARGLSSGASLSVGHYAHLTGAVWGAACFLARFLWRRTRERRIGGVGAAANFGAGGGRRLGGTTRAPPRR